jgi:type IV secretory pathway VirB10-like protein
MSGAGWPTGGAGRGEYQGYYPQLQPLQPLGAPSGPSNPFAASTTAKTQPQPLQPLGAPSGPSNPFAASTTAKTQPQPLQPLGAPSGPSNPFAASTTAKTQPQPLQPLGAPSESGRRVKAMNEKNGRKYNYSKTESELINSCRNDGMKWKTIADTYFPGKTAISIRLHHDRYNNLSRSQNT